MSNELLQYAQTVMELATAAYVSLAQIVCVVLIAFIAVLVTYAARK